MITHTNRDFKGIVTGEIPLIDVRAPLEFKQGAFINAVNLPLMNDEERHLVGTCYAKKGSDEAVKLGHELVTGEKRQERIEAWVSFITQNPEGMLYCFRGGLRSQISQRWIFEATGKKVMRLEGGYKAFRNFLLNALNPDMQKSIPVLLGGYTGSGKTQLLKSLNNSIDLEGISNHRGSSFGGQLTPQPTQISFENDLAYALIQHEQEAYKYMILEDEGTNIGKCRIPEPLYQYFNLGELVLLELPFDQRVQNTMNEYVIQSQKEYVTTFGEEQGLSEWYAYISSSMSKLKKRLGGERYKRLVNLFEFAYNQQMIFGNSVSHEKWIDMLLKEYYDPMYEYQIQKNVEKIVFRGKPQEVVEYLTDLNKITL